MPEFLQVLAADSVVDMFSKAGPLVKTVMAVLALMSIAGWYVIGFKYFYIKRATRETMLFLDAFWRSKDIEHIYKTAQSLRHSPPAAMFLAGYTELAKLTNDGNATRSRDTDLENVERSLRRTQLTEGTKLESMVPFLATTGSAAPFIGLFGTVWGIMTTFQAISEKGSATLQTVGPGISEALLATAIGLVAAIPAVMAYNYFQRRIRVHMSQMHTFEQDYLNIIRRHFLS
jgi:biopolymer transport protein TolQ